MKKVEAREEVQRTVEFLKKVKVAINKRIFVVKNGELAEAPETRFNYGLKRVLEEIERSFKRIAKDEKEIYMKHCIVHEKGDMKDAPVIAADGKSFTFTVEGQKEVDAEIEALEQKEVDVRPYFCNQYVTPNTKLTLTEINLFRGLVITEEKADELDENYDIKD